MLRRIRNQLAGRRATQRPDRSFLSWECCEPLPPARHCGSGLLGSRSWVQAIEPTRMRLAVSSIASTRVSTSRNCNVPTREIPVVIGPLLALLPFGEMLNADAGSLGANVLLLSTAAPDLVASGPTRPLLRVAALRFELFAFHDRHKACFMP